MYESKNVKFRMTGEQFKEVCQWLRNDIKGTPREGHLFAVGGCCRDSILGDNIKDIDLAVDLLMVE